MAQSARTLVGARFRLHGRDIAGGLDCVGVLAVALELSGQRVDLPNGYSLHSARLPDLERIAASNGFSRLSEEPCAAGDIVMLRCGANQFHLAISDSNSSFVHAHAGLRRVVQQQGPLPWPIIQHWRLRAAEQEAPWLL